MHKEESSAPDYPVIPEERSSDVCNLELAESAGLILFMAGNQFMLMDELTASFQSINPETGTIVYETLPPGLELKQILAGGAVFAGRTYRLQPDVYSSVSEQAMETLAEHDLVGKNDYFVYLHNRLALMVRKGNPRGIKGVEDLARKDVTVSQPGAEYEHIASHAIAMYQQSGGRQLVDTILEEKRKEGTTIFTTVHHRETPERIVSGLADAGPVWYTEIVEAEKAGLELEGVEVGTELDQRQNINYFIAPVRTGRNPENARKFLDFITSPAARRIFENHGFIT
ncbi:MAG: molybdate ABC transporter substrate-binding protein [Thermodesulfobacteriota bacterium]